MSKDNLLFATIGVLLGFIGGYLMHEVMVARQPLRRPAAEQTAALPVGPGAQVGPEAAPDPSSGPAVAPGDGSTAPGMAEIQKLREHVESHPNDAPAVLELANLNYNISNWQRARDLYERYVKLVSPTGEVLTDLGTCYRNLNQFDRALELFRRAEGLAPTNWQARFNEVVVLGIDLNKLDEASAKLTELQQMQPGNADVAQLAAEITRRRGAR